MFNNIYLSLYCKGSKRVTQSLRVRGSWRPNISCNILTSHSYGRQRCVFLVLQGCSTGGPGPTLLGNGFPYCIFSATSLVPKLHRGFRGPSWPGIAFPTTSRLSPTGTRTQLATGRNSNCLQLNWHRNSTGLNFHFDCVI